MFSIVRFQPVRARALGLGFAALLAVSACSGAGAGDTAARSATPAPDQQGHERAQSPSSTPPEEGPQLPGGGRTMFPDRRVVALYGAPGTPGLGVLGEYEPEEAVAAAKKQAKAYEAFSDVPVQAGFEIIATVAAGSPGPDGSYSVAHSEEQLRPLIDAATKNDLHVVLDLQPGRTHFLEQAKLYENLLEQPNVHLALDPEWRLTEPGMRHIATVGHVKAAEVNEVSDWLAKLVREHNLPQKMLIVHQFEDQMIRDRATLDASHKELALTLHMDGHGDRRLKTDTYARVNTDLPKGMRPAWKNFIDEDTPTFTPKETMAVNPKPWFVSYQ